MPFLHTMIKYAADRGGLAGRVADVGLRAMKKRCVDKNGKVSYNKVELGRRMDTEYELISGVDNNSQVVIAGQSKLADGVEVEVEK